MTIKEVILIISYIGFFSSIALGLFYISMYKGDKNFKKMFCLFTIPLILTLSFPVFVLTTSAINNSHFNSFDFVVGTKLEEIDYDDIYESIYNKSHAEAELLLSRDHKDMKVFLDKDGKIIEFSIRVVIPKNEQYYYYTSYYENEKLIFVASKAVEEKDLLTVRSFKTYFDRLNNFDLNFIYEQLKDEVYQNGIGIDVSFNYFENITTITLSNDSSQKRNQYAYDKDNTLYQNVNIDAMGEYIGVTLAYLPKEITDEAKDSFDVITIFGKDYYYKNKDLVYLINFTS